MVCRQPAVKCVPWAEVLRDGSLLRHKAKWENHWVWGCYSHDSVNAGLKKLVSIKVGCYKMRSFLYAAPFLPTFTWMLWPAQGTLSRCHHYAVWTFQQSEYQNPEPNKSTCITSHVASGILLNNIIFIKTPVLWIFKNL